MAVFIREGLPKRRSDERLGLLGFKRSFERPDRVPSGVEQKVGPFRSSWTGREGGMGAPIMKGYGEVLGWEKTSKCEKAKG